MDHQKREDARRLIDQIRLENGSIDESQLAKTPPDVLKALESIRGQLAQTTMRPSREPYTNSTPFVFELIQLAEDSSYSSALTKNKAPFLSLNLSSHKITVDSNENGFREDDVRAVCKTAKSTERGLRGYTGEKRIGFQSVFKVAAQVHVQSEPYSFFLRCSPEDDNMGMFMPYNKEFENLPTGVSTRITLLLREDLNLDNLVHEFYELPGTTLLFLNTLTKLTISVDRYNRYFKREYSYKYDTRLSEGTLIEKNSAPLDKYDTKISRFLIERKSVSSLPLDLSRQGIRSAEVILAFQIDQNDMPVILQQQMFALVPVNQANLRFLVQSDFVTRPGSGVVLDSPWNQALRDEVVETFWGAVLRFCKHSVLQWTWIRYFPSEDLLDPFWSQLRASIRIRLRQERIFRTWTTGKSKLADQLRFVSDHFRDERGQPLFNDLDEEVYLSNSYSLKDRHALEAIGVQPLKLSEVLERISADLGAESSKMKDPTTSQEWHTRSAQWLLNALRHDRYDQKLRSLELIPLQSQQWTSMTSGRLFKPIVDHVFDPMVDDAEVPEQLGFRLVSKQACLNPKRRELFQEAGMKKCQPTDVINRIIRRYSECENLNFTDSLSHLRFLFCHHSTEAGPIDENMVLFDSEENPVFRVRAKPGRDNLIVNDLYFESKNKFSAQRLSSKQGEGSSEREVRTMHTLHPSYLEAEVPRSYLHDLSWKDWLEKYAEVMSYPRLVERKHPGQLSDLFQWIMKNRTYTILGTLRTHWEIYSSQMRPEIVDELKVTLVPCVNGDEICLNKTYIPQPELVIRARDLSVETRLPFLKFPSEFDEEPIDSWRFLEIFGVSATADLDFYLKALFALQDSDIDWTAENRKVLLEIYQKLGQTAKVDDYGYLRKVFGENDIIQTGDEDFCDYYWTSAKECLWKATGPIRTKCVLSNDDEYFKNKKIEHLFNNILEIGDANWRLYLDEIRDNALSRDNINLKDISDIYRLLWKSVDGGEDDETWEEVRKCFGEEKLIITDASGKAYSAFDCIWNERSHIPGVQPIAAIFSDLEEFFVKKIRVPEPTLETYIAELQLISDMNSDVPLDEIKDLLNKINSFKPDCEDLSRLHDYKILPVEEANGRKMLMRPDDTFVIFDHPKYRDLFDGRLARLELSVKEIRDMTDLISALNLDDRYASRIISESSEVEGESKDSPMTEDLRNRAAFLYRCLLHYKRFPSGEDDDLFQNLSCATVYRTDDIKNVLNISINEQNVNATDSRGLLHVKEKEGMLEIFVPQLEELRIRCFYTQLPRKLLNHWDIDDESAMKVFGDVLTAPVRSLDGILDEYGISNFSEEQSSIYRSTEEDARRDQKTITSSASERSTEGDTRREQDTWRSSDSERSSSGDARKHQVINNLSDLERSTRSVRRDQGTNNSSDSERRIRRDARREQDKNDSSGSERSIGLSQFIVTSNLRHERRANIVLHTDPEEAVVGDNQGAEDYKELLDHVISVAEESQLVLPRRSLQEEDGGSSPCVISPKYAVDHDFKIGAAGELYVFKLLQKQGLPGFGVENWKSRIRHFVCVHEDYHEIQPWNGKETADIVYKDSASNLTSKLIKGGYVEREAWFHKKPRYYIEVKTTTGKCDTPFYMSKAQVKRMKHCRLDPDKASSKVYVIMRVFNLGRQDIGLRILIDPASMKNRGELVFKAEQYTVRQTNE